MAEVPACRQERFEWDEIYGEALYSWYGTSPATRSLFSLCVDAEFQGSGAGRALTQRLLEVAEAHRYGPEFMSLRVHDINERAWRLYEEVGFRRVPERTEEMPVRELEGFPGRRVPPMENWYMERRMNYG